MAPCTSLIMEFEHRRAQTIAQNLAGHCRDNGFSFVISVEFPDEGQECGGFMDADGEHVEEALEGAAGRVRYYRTQHPRTEPLPSRAYSLVPDFDETA